MQLWSEEDGQKHWLFTPEEFAHLPDGFELLGISGGAAVKGIDPIDQDTRAGVIAFGVLDPETHPRAKDITLALLKAKNATT